MIIINFAGMPCDCIMSQRLSLWSESNCFLEVDEIDYQGRLPFACLLDNITQNEDLLDGISPFTFRSKLGTDAFFHSSDENHAEHFACNYKNCYASPITTILQVTFFGDLHD